MTMSQVYATPQSTGGTSRADQWLGTSLIALGAGLVVNSLLGPFVFEVVDYPLSETVHNQTIGLDAVALLLVAPLSMLTGALAWRGHRAALFGALAVGAYTSYMFVQYVVGPSYLEFPRDLPLQLGLFTLGWVAVVLAWSRVVRLDDIPLPTGVRHAAALFAFAGFVLLRWLPTLPGIVAGDPIPADATADPAMFWTIVLMDLGIFVPVAIAAGVGLLRGRVWAQRVLYAATGWFVLVTAAVTAMAITMMVNGDVYAAIPQTVLFVVTAVLATVYAARLYRPLFVGRG